MDKIPGGTMRKLVVSIVGILAVILGPSVLGIAPGEELFGIGQETAVGLILGMLTAVGVYMAPNDAA
jgi:hypothetical protein